MTFQVVAKARLEYGEDEMTREAARENIVELVKNGQLEITTEIVEEDE